MLEREIGLTGKEPEHAAPIPPSSEARVEGERTIHQSNGNIDVLANVAEHEGPMAKDVRVVGSESNCPSSEVDTRMPVCLAIVGPTVDVELDVAHCREGKRRAISRIALDRPSE